MRDASDTLELAERFARHCKDAAFAPSEAERAYARAMARGLHRIMTERGLAGDPNVSIGAPHFITYREDL